jgi:peptidoglycan/LPS O-acetylase OafA/YrhL
VVRTAASPVTGSFFTEIESLRGIACFLVLLLHMQGWLRWGLEDPSGWWPVRVLMLSGHTGVSLFFVISGFLLGRPFIAEMRGGARVPRRSYAARRARRILPLYVLAVVVASAATATHLVHLLRGLPYLLFLQAVPGLTERLSPFSEVWWSLSTEVQCYLLLPLLPLVWARFGRRGTVVAGTLAVLAYLALALRWWAPRDGLTSVALMHSVLGRGPVFACGVAAAAVWVAWGEPLRARLAGSFWWRHGIADLLIVLNFTALMMLLGWVASMGYWAAEREWQIWHLLEGVLWSTWLLGMLCLPARLKILFCNPIWAGLGVISYSVYVWHHPIIVYWSCWVPGAVGADLRALVIGAGGVIVTTVALSALSYRFVERPFLRRD